MRLGSHYRALRYLGEYLVDSLEVGGMDIFWNDWESYLFLAGIGARVCYSSQLDFDDPRLHQDLVSYLGRLYAKGHYSVFAHVPVKLHIGAANFFYAGGIYNLFKATYDPAEEILYLNLRHIIEAFSLLDLSWDIVVEKLGLLDIQDWDLREWEDIGIYTVVSGDWIHIFEPEDYWYVVYIREVDRATTHQIVRHQTLNFNQQSQRYVKLGTPDIPVPWYIKHWDGWGNIMPYVGYAYRKYREIVSHHILRKEDARLILPNATKSAIVISGDKEAWESFLGQRMDKHAQWMIRTVAEGIREGIEKLG